MEYISEATKHNRISIHSFIDAHSGERQHRVEFDQDIWQLLPLPLCILNRLFQKRQQTAMCWVEIVDSCVPDYVGDLLVCFGNDFHKHQFLYWREKRGRYKMIRV